MKKISLAAFVREILREFSKEKSQQDKDITKVIQKVALRSHEIEAYFEELASKSHASFSKIKTVNIENENWVRAVSIDYAKKPLSYQGSLLSNSRFGQSGQPTLYLAENHDVAAREVQFPEYFQATTLFGIKVNLQFILDLSGTKSLANYKVLTNLFVGEWKKFNNLGIKFYTQYLSDYLRTLPIEGFIYQSNQSEKNRCLCIFPDKLVKGSSLAVHGTYKEIHKEDLTIIAQI